MTKYEQNQCIKEINSQYSKLPANQITRYENAWILNDFESKILGIFRYALNKKDEKKFTLVLNYLIQNKNALPKIKIKIFYDEYIDFYGDDLKCINEKFYFPLIH